MCIGDKVNVTLTAGGDWKQAVAATVIYIHPKRRFFVVEHLAEAGRPVREAFPFWRKSMDRYLTKRERADVQ